MLRTSAFENSPPEVRHLRLVVHFGRISSTVPLLLLHIWRHINCVKCATTYAALCILDLYFFVSASRYVQYQWKLCLKCSADKSYWIKQLAHLSRPAKLTNWEKSWFIPSLFYYYYSSEVEIKNIMGISMTWLNYLFCIFSSVSLHRFIIASSVASCLSNNL